MKNYKIFLTLFFFILISELAYSQANILEKKISLRSKNKTIENVINEISEKTNIEFSYSNDIDLSNKISISAKEKALSKILNSIFSETNIKYELIENHIILKNKSANAENKTSSQNKKFTISGYIKDSQSGEVLIDATISVKNKNMGVFTNSYGFYSISLPEGTYFLSVSYLGYETLVEEIILDKNIRFSRNLQRKETAVEVVVITEDDKAESLENNATQKVKISKSRIFHSNGIGGEPNIISAIQSTAGIHSLSEGSTFFYVRGGNKDQNLIILDEAPLYNPSHLFGFFPSVSPNIINDIKIYKNAFPVKYGGKLSSLIDIKIKDGNNKKLQFAGKLNPFISSHTIDGPIKKANAVFLANLRNSHVNWALDKKYGFDKMNFYDFHAKLKFILNSKNKLYFSFYTGSDFIKSNKVNFTSKVIDWNNTTGTIRWNRLLSNKLFLNTIAYFSRYNSKLYSSYENNEFWNSLIGNISLKTDFKYYASPKNTFNFGANINGIYFNPGNLNNQFFQRKLLPGNVAEFVLYAGDKINIKNKVLINIGLRAVSWNNIGEARTLTYNQETDNIDTTFIKQNEIFNSEINFEPSFNISYQFNNKLIIFGNYNRNVQNIHLLSNNTSPFSSLEAWLPSGEKIKAQKLNNFSLGFSKKNIKTEFSSEIYFKYIKNQTDYIDHANMMLNSLIEYEITQGIGLAYGIEFTYNKTIGNLNFYTTYSYSKIHKIAEGINSNRFYLAYYCKPHKLNINTIYNISKRLSASLNFTFSSGTRFSSPTGFYSYQNHAVPIYTKKNNSQLPAYHRMDISVNYKLNRKTNNRYKHEIIFAIINLYGRKNPISINFNKVEGENGTYYIPANYIYENELVTTSMFTFGFFPSLTYSFNLNYSYKTANNYAKSID